MKGVVVWWSWWWVTTWDWWRHWYRSWWLALVTGGREIYSIKEEEESHGGVVAH
jgi:hypothetical protein